jgi:DNA processing protein
LREISDPPKVLRVRGAISINPEERFLCIVGSRKYSPYGKEVVMDLLEGLRDYPVTIVSGLALGIDGIAHKEALRLGIRTIGVPGSGLNDSVLYPRSHQHLAKKILHSGGALVSEFENDFKATPWAFPKRNRIMAGLSHATLVVEATKKSGSLITARLAMEYSRDVCTVPGSIFSKNSEGPHSLIKNGATPITNSKEILEVLRIKTKEENSKMFIKNLSENERKIFILLKEPCSKENLTEKLDLSTQEINITLSTMELKGLIRESMGKIKKIES